MALQYLFLLLVTEQNIAGSLNGMTKRPITLKLRIAFPSATSIHFADLNSERIQQNFKWALFQLFQSMFPYDNISSRNPTKIPVGKADYLN